MTTLERLHQEAFDQDIDVVYLHVCSHKKSMCLSEDGYKEIVIDKAAVKGSAEEALLLAEELAHFETGLMYYLNKDFNTPAHRMNRDKAEAQVRRYAMRKLLPAAKIKKCWAQGITDLWEMAEELTFDADYILNAIQDYRVTGELPQPCEHSSL